MFNHILYCLLLHALCWKSTPMTAGVCWNCSGATKQIVPAIFANDNKTVPSTISIFKQWITSLVKRTSFSKNAMLTAFFTFTDIC